MTDRNVPGTSGAQDRPMISRQSFTTVAALTSVLSGLVGLFAPGQMGLLFGLTLDDVAVAEVRLLGAAYLGYATLAWFARDVTDLAAVRAIALGSAASWAISAVVTVTAIISGLIGWQGWLLVGVEAAFAAAWTSFALPARATVAGT